MQKLFVTIFKLSEIEKKQLDEILAKFGCNKSEFMRQLIRDKYLKVFPAYIVDKNKKSAEQEYLEGLMAYMPEKLCEMIPNAEVVKDEGLFKCRIQINKASRRYIPLKKDLLITYIKDLKKEGKM